jgi:hypothetical protein
MPTNHDHPPWQSNSPSGDTKLDRAQPPTKNITTASPVIILRRAVTVNATAVDSIAMTHAIDPTIAVAVKEVPFQKASILYNVSLLFLQATPQELRGLHNPSYW